MAKLEEVRDLKVVHQSIVVAEKTELGLAQTQAGPCLAMLGSSGSLLFGLFKGESSSHGGQRLLVGPTNADNAAGLRTLLPWLRPKTLGLRTSAGLGDRMGLATPGHVRAVRASGGSIAPIFAQQSIREMKRTGRSPQQVMDDATWGIFQEGWREGAGADADHLKTTADIDVCVPAGFTFFTVDPGDHVDNTADGAMMPDLCLSFERLPWDQLEDDQESLKSRYLAQSWVVEGHEIPFDEFTLLRAAVKYGRALAHVAAMYRHLMEVARGGSWELEVSVDETETPTTHAEHIYIVQELRRLNVRWVSLAPRYIGRFEKGVDYMGDLCAFEADFAIHAAIARQLGPYKLSLHSGSDKFSVYPIAMRQTKGLVHLKTAGTSYLEALRTIAALDADFFRSVYAFARQRYETDRASYHVSARLERVPLPQDVADRDLPALLEQFDVREILHVTFGSVLTACTEEGDRRFYNRLMSLLRSHPEAYAANLQTHFLRHLRPFVQG
jgi:hypothetical protein